MLVALRLVGRRRLLPAIYGSKEEWKYLCLPTVRAALPELTELFAPDFVGGLAGPALRCAAVEPSIGKRAERSLSTARPTRLSGAWPHSGSAAERFEEPSHQVSDGALPRFATTDDRLVHEGPSIFRVF